MRASAILAMALAACGGARKADPAGPEPRGPDAAVTGGGADGGASSGEPAPPIDGDASAGPPPRPPTGPLTAAECGRLVDTMIAIGLAEQRARNPGAKQATPAQQAAIRDRLLAESGPTCSAVARATFDCAVAATDRVAMSACQDAAPR